MKVLKFEGKRIVEIDVNARKIDMNIFVDDNNVYWFYPEIKKAIIIDDFKKLEKINYRQKMERTKKDTIKNYIERLKNEIEKGNYVSSIELLLVDSKLSDKERKLFDSVKNSTCAKIIEDKSFIQEKTKELENELDLIKKDFINCDYVENKKFKLYKNETTYKEISALNLLAISLGIKISPRTKRWIEDYVLGFWGNKKVKCEMKSDKIFEILNSIMENLKKH